MAKRKLSFKQWRKEIDRLLMKRVSSTWNDLAGDLEPLQSAYADGDTPGQFVQHIIDKFDLDDTPIDHPYGANPAARRNPPMSFATMALYGAGAYLLLKYVFFKNS